ncbi:hypothetical protein FQA39_LY06395 [Lamprigera yunnana]|nr:hypothetical protein FQA39_LY06395 [Lamprigera yunnana]
MLRLNSYAAVLRRHAILTEQERKYARKLALAKKPGITFPDDHPAVVDRRKAVIQKYRSIKFPVEATSAKPEQRKSSNNKGKKVKGPEEKEQKDQFSAEVTVNEDEDYAEAEVEGINDEEEEEFNKDDE